jgi:hypothetical protein
VKRYYICPLDVWQEPINILGRAKPRYHLMDGSQWVQLSDTHILLLTEFETEWAEGQWHDHPEVARLACPQMEATVPLYSLCSDPQFSHKQFGDHHWVLLANSFGLKKPHTVWDLHNKLKDTYPGMRLKAVY